MINRLEVARHVVFVVDAPCMRFGRIPTDPKLSITAVLLDQGAIGIINFTLLQAEWLPAYANVHMIRGPNVRLLGCGVYA